MISAMFCRRWGVVVPTCSMRLLLKRSSFKKAVPVKLKVKLSEESSRIRNIGIIAHIDAGKTTTTERILYYSGFSNVMGEVHDGDTVMDYMEQERQRGITITSAAIAFNWNRHQINLIDTPGHVDFTIEVERSLRILDGAVAILDASAGVEAQTVTVWTQADRYRVPRIVYLNKMDKPKSSVDLCIRGLKDKLNAVPVCLHIPLYTSGRINGVVDLLTLDIIKWKVGSECDGSEFTRTPLSKDNLDLWNLALKNREKLVELIADLDNDVAEQVITSENPSEIKADILQSALRRLTLNHLAVPVLCGSSYRNVGVQLLMDAIITYLPNPEERQYHFVPYYKGQLCSLAFKISHDKIRGPLTYLRLYSGTLKEGQSIYNASQDVSEKINKIMLAFADDLKEVPMVSQGQIAVISGLAKVVTGDTLLSSKTSFENALKMLNKSRDIESDSCSALLAGIQVPDPVFFCSIEAPSLSTQITLDRALDILQKEDPTLKVSVNPESGQTIIAGMGELHIDIVKDRILKEHNVEAYLGPLQVSYREAIETQSRYSHVLDKTLGGVKQYVEIVLVGEFVAGAGVMKDLKVKAMPENDLGKLRTDHMKYIRNGVQLALSHGPLLGCPVIDISLTLLKFKTTFRTSPAMISAAASQCVNGLLRNCGVRLLEPIMKLEIVCDKIHKDKLLEDLYRRRSVVVEVYGRHDLCVILCKTPLSELRKYSSILRKFTSGSASFSMEFDSYIVMDEQQQKLAIKDMTGFEPA